MWNNGSNIGHRSTRRNYTRIVNFTTLVSSISWSILELNSGHSGGRCKRRSFTAPCREPLPVHAVASPYPYTHSRKESMPTVETRHDDSSSSFRLDVPLHNLLMQPGSRTPVRPSAE